MFPGFVTSVERLDISQLQYLEEAANALQGPPFPFPVDKLIHLVFEKRRAHLRQYQDNLKLRATKKAKLQSEAIPDFLQSFVDNGRKKLTE